MTVIEHIPSTPQRRALERMEQRSGIPTRTMPAVAFACCEGNAVAGVYRDRSIDGPDARRITGILERIDKAVGPGTFVTVACDSAPALADVLRAVPVEPNSHTPASRCPAPARVGGGFFNARLLARAVRMVGGTVAIRAAEPGDPRRHARPLILERVKAPGLQVFVMPLRPPENNEQYPVLWEDV